VILVEKGTCGMVVKPTTDKYQVPLFVSAGYYSRTFLVRLAKFIWDNRDKLVYIGYCGGVRVESLDGSNDRGALFTAEI
jgi:hypothetical protein